MYIHEHVEITYLCANVLWVLMAYLYEYMRRFLHLGCRFLGSYVVIPMTLFLLKIFKHSPHLVVLSGALVRRWRDWELGEGAQPSIHHHHGGFLSVSNFDLGS